MAENNKWIKCNRRSHPKFGEHFLIKIKCSDWLSVGFYSEDMGQWCALYGNECVPKEVTHYMKLPKLPKKGE